MFQVTLLEYGYTFIGKATTIPFVPDLEHEGQVYERIQALQGVHVPVFLGQVNLQEELGRTYYYDIDVRLTYMIFLSWGGRNLVRKVKRVKIKESLLRSLEALHACGVAHTDVRVENVLWDEGTERAMLIDFERAVISEPSQVGPVSANSDKAQLEEAGMEAKMQHDISQAKILLSVWTN